MSQELHNPKIHQIIEKKRRQQTEKEWEVEIEPWIRQFSWNEEERRTRWKTKKKTEKQA